MPSSPEQLDDCCSYQVNFSFVSSRNLYIDSSDEGLGFNKFGLSRTTEIKGPDDEELSMTDLVMGSDEELAFQMSQMEFKSQADEDHSLAELMSRLKDVASESSGSASRPPSPPDQADEP
uniref:Uncharacterized protein n=1 Tax=Arundo donax TaxID=35708 RepID=A0A0A9EXL8_ARUDO